MEQAVVLILSVLGLYLLVGAAFAIPFHAGWGVRLDPKIKGAGWLFRLLITPGVIALWPILALRVWNPPIADAPPSGASMARLRGRQLLAMQALAVFLPPLFAAAIMLRPTPPPPQSIHDLGVTAKRLSGSATELATLFPSLSIAGRIRNDGTARQLELDVTQDLALPATALFWSAGSKAPSASPEGLQFIGSIYGPATLRYNLPAGVLANEPGALILFSLTRSELIASAPWPKAEDP
jgi:hypothetical protein